MLNAYIKLKNGDVCAVNNISVIKEFSSENTITEYKDFTKFMFFSNKYIFVGDEILAVYGTEIVYVSFSVN